MPDFLYQIAHAGVLIVAMVLLIPISAIVLGIGTGIIKIITQSQERKLQMKLAANQQASNALPNAAIEELRREIAMLRDTSTEHAMSLQHTVERLECRLEFLEQRASESSVVQQTIRRRG